MFRSRRPAVKPRALAALLTLAAHAVLGVLLVLQGRGGPRPVPVVREVHSIAITLLPLVRPDAAPVRVEGDLATPVAPRPDTAPRADVDVPEPATPTRRSADAPATAITLPSVPAQADAPAPAQRDAGEWYAQAEALAARFAEQHEAPAATIGQPAPRMREPCKPRESSFEWKSGSRNGGSASLTLGWEEPEPNKHLFDDMMAGRRTRSSVPDPNVCD